MTENIKQLREIVEHNIQHEATRIEASVVLDLIEAEMRELRSCIYHTAPGEMEFGGEGWTWKQQARADHDRLLAVEAERNKAQRDLEVVAMRLDELHAKIDALARKAEP